MHFVSRTLSFQFDKERIRVDAQTALEDPRLAGRPLILLGEAGSGKSDLLKEWAGDQVVTAQQLIVGRRVSGNRCVIDGLDEAAGLHNGDAIDRLLGRLEDQRVRDFVIACRVADWRSTSAAKIRHWTGETPVELTLEPLCRDNAEEFLALQMNWPKADVDVFVAHYESRGLGEWLGNPQTLTMLAKSAARRPETMGELFRIYVDASFKEPSRQDTPLADRNKSVVLDALGGLFAALIVGGYDAVTQAPGANQSPGDLPLAEWNTLPALESVEADWLKDFLNSRLVATVGVDRFTYAHRRIGEYLGAQWLAGQARTVALRRRLLSALRHGGTVPAGLRGLWGWLARDPKLAADIVRSDPLAVLEYGDADALPADLARMLLTALETAEDQGPAFGWRSFRAASLVDPELVDEVERVLAIADNTRVWTQHVILAQMRTRDVVSRHRETLRRLMLDETRPYSIRADASDALAAQGDLRDWPSIVRDLARRNNRDSLRMALVLMLNPTIGLVLGPSELAETMYAYSGLTPRVESGGGVGVVALYYYGPHQPIADSQLDDMLDALAKYANRYPNERGIIDVWDLDHLFASLLRRRLDLEGVDADRLWNWISASASARDRGARDEWEWLTSWLAEHGDDRKAILRCLIDVPPEKLWPLLIQLPPGLWPRPGDVIHLLNALPEGDPRWREVFRLSPVREDGKEARRAAERHVRTDEDRQLLWHNAEPPPNPYEAEHAKWDEERQRNRQARLDGLRQEYRSNRHRMRAGEWPALVNPAAVYLGRTTEVERSLPPEDRIGAWIGEDLQADALAGFEAFLTASPSPPPSAVQIADSHAESRHWHAGSILVAALAERRRTGRGFEDLPTERLQAGLFAERTLYLDDNTWEELREALTAELEARDTWVETARLFIEPQLRKRSTYVSWLWRVLASDAGAALAAEWLQTFPRMAAEPEETLIDQLLKMGGDAERQALTNVARRRRRQRLVERRRTTWKVVELILGAQPPGMLAEIAAGNPVLIWAFRDRLEGRRRDQSSIIATPALLAEIIRHFAPHWSNVGHPSGMTSGNDNPWDATDFLNNCLDRLASDSRPEAGAALATLANIDYGYTSMIGRCAQDQRRAHAEAEWKPIDITALGTLLKDGPPITHADFQHLLLAELNQVQAVIWSSSLDVWKNFYTDVKRRDHKSEEECTQQLISLLQQSDRRFAFAREEYRGDNRRCDISCQSGDLNIPVECKGQWHPHLWTAFDWQLAGQQALDYRSGGYGIYVVYWFGTASTDRLQGPPRGSGTPFPTSAADLEAALRDRVAMTGHATIAVKVLDVSRAPK